MLRNGGYYRKSKKTGNSFFINSYCRTTTKNPCDSDPHTRRPNILDDGAFSSVVKQHFRM